MPAIINLDLSPDTGRMNGRSISTARTRFSPAMTRRRKLGFVASLVEACKLNDVDPQTYFADVLDKLVNLWPVANIDELMPWAWTKSRTTDQRAA